eukprot:GHVH01008854.1.p1 GENE.GHVH01008854.1~~GHVH01008854.1.p1  ORF type:complete len:156 (+),score=14.97 GHVH01008854.1:72-539(+)
MLSDPQTLRFVAELEFIQSLANPEYLSFLAKGGYLNEPAFLRFLKYLDYWRRPEYVEHIIFPHSLRMLTALHDQDFRNKLSTHEGLMALKIQQANSWLCYRRQSKDFDEIVNQFLVHTELSDPPPGQVIPQFPWQREEAQRIANAQKLIDERNKK